MHGMDKRYLLPKGFMSRLSCYLWSFALWFVYKIHGLLWGWFFNIFEVTSHAAFIPFTRQNAKKKLSKSWLHNLLPQRGLKPCIIFLSCLRFFPFFLLFLPQTMNLPCPCFKK